jgi:hypothetical protein
MPRLGTAPAVIAVMDAPDVSPDDDARFGIYSKCVGRVSFGFSLSHMVPGSGTRRMACLIVIRKHDVLSALENAHYRDEAISNAMLGLRR